MNEEQIPQTIVLPKYILPLLLTSVVFSFIALIFSIIVFTTSSTHEQDSSLDESMIAEQCSEKNPCYGDFVCDDGQCVGVAECTADDDCASGVCYKGNCTEDDDADFKEINESFSAIGDLYFELPNDSWAIDKTESDRQINIISSNSSVTELTVSEMSVNPVDVSGGIPSFTSDSADIYKDGCGGGWCAFYIIDFYDGSQYDVFFTGDPINDEDMKIILTSFIK